MSMRDAIFGYLWILKKEYLECFILETGVECQYSEETIKEVRMEESAQIKLQQDKFDTRFKAFANELHEDGPIMDGILLPDQYVQVKRKILFIAKEPNDDAGNWDFKYPKEPYKNNNFWFPLKYITYGILNPELSWEEIPVVTESKEVNEVLYNVAYININKFPSGATTDMQHLKERYIKYRDMLLEQLKIMNPEIVICMGTFETIKEDLVDSTFSKIEKRNRSAYYNNDLIVLDWYHVGYSYGKRGIEWEDYCKDAIDVCKECMDKQLKGDF